MRLFLLLTFLFGILFVELATIFVDFTFVGKVGTFIGSLNRKLFGLLSYLLPLLSGLILFMKPRVGDRELWPKIVGGGLILVALVLAQALLLPSHLGGAIGLAIVDLLAPYIGIIGLWLLFLLLLSLASILLELPKPGFSLASFSQLLAKGRRLLNDPPPIELPTPPAPKVQIDPIQPSKRNQTKKQNKGKTTKANSPKETPSTTTPKSSPKKGGSYSLPPLDLLTPPPPQGEDEGMGTKAEELVEKLAQFNIEGSILRTIKGPLVSTFEFKPAPKVKVSKILGLQDDLAMALKAPTLRILAPVPGKDVVGIEVPNPTPQTIYLREILESPAFAKSEAALPLALGKDVTGEPFVTDLATLPHLLIAGSTGSGKSVGINAMLLGLLYRHTPATLRLLMIDPKMLEFSIYEGLPHLLEPVITQPSQALEGLQKMVEEMERRYQLMSKERVKNIASFNKKMAKKGQELLPYIVVIIDELADLMMSGGKDVEYAIARLAQMARAAGIHLIVATQRPSVDVVTGLIKANLPARIAFRVGQKVDSRVILDTGGAQNLLGRGDMLFAAGGSPPLRLHAPWVSEEEIERVVSFFKRAQPKEDPLTKVALERFGKRPSLAKLQQELEISKERAKRILSQLRRYSES
ncbi:MAG: DNA translocase FtsK [Epsilonproteobacteria bacterium]|nr:DNA translocase FtsK [Campylobacterota bacterium]